MRIRGVYSQTEWRDYIWSALRQHDWTVNKLSEYLELDNRLIYRWLNGENANYSTMARAVLKLGVPFTIKGEGLTKKGAEVDG